ncbi:MAG: hypothetical protein JW882_07690 [Deltaproteobacteria bacterium]|nr:hypothetical protein [Deltaproteobacteria bacterium]
MIKKFREIISAIFLPSAGEWSFSGFDLSEQLDSRPKRKADIIKSLNSAFLIYLANEGHARFNEAKGFLEGMKRSSLSDIAEFFIRGAEMMRREIEDTCRLDPDFSDNLNSLHDFLIAGVKGHQHENGIEKIWSLFFPEGTGIRKNRENMVVSLRSDRVVDIAEINRDPISNPAVEILFTSNALLTVPPLSERSEGLCLSDKTADAVKSISGEEQLYWYDHPVQVGVTPEKNEILYGLRGLDEAVQFEKENGNMGDDERVTCVLSVSVTHRGLHSIAREYIEDQLKESGGLDNLDLYVFTEADTMKMLDEILAPAAEYFYDKNNAAELMAMFGVDGEYGRHYSFLKAVSALWQCFVQKDLKATFKIDLDQVFPQNELLRDTGATAFDHFRTDLWGAAGMDSTGKSVDLGMIAGALVNKGDMEESLFSPDVRFPGDHIALDEYVFKSSIPQALSTEAEMSARYSPEGIDGITRCIQRVHVTGGTTGILIDSLKRYRPFTPSFIGRAEDQAYVMSAVNRDGPRLAYLHKDGLIMRHDKEAFAGDAIKAARVSKLIGDYIRILYFSAYALEIRDEIREIKEFLDPFTGCFISKIPVTLVLLRFCLKAAQMFYDGKDDEAIEFMINGVKRINHAIEFSSGPESPLKKRYEEERIGWDLYYDTLLSIEINLKQNNRFALELKNRAQAIFESCRIGD